MPPKRQLVKLKVSPEFLKTLPVFATPKAKRVKKIAEDKKNEKNDKTSSPGPHDDNSKVNSGMKELSTAGLTVHSVNANFALDKSGRPAKKWVRGSRQFKTFSGFKVKLKTWRHKSEREKHDPPKEETPQDSLPKQEEVGSETPSEATAITA
ncbi:uncharacterized protein CXQ87_001030 [Candidozyma duobushaemuli]|uniref:Uncharacterized protein n=1 Tax=Candidozyma duobushaemuli TaxID=1231522 RepID=A0A2V1ALJ3_9ASCO|nr:uncharacterized protein CXQ87_001030 [[Candida] duobushaemulonis]PVH18113.1 hypothetical protein CXQ87_001030 [[Candida] duobushaemulonis]